MTTLTSLPTLTGIEAAERQRNSDHLRALRAQTPSAGVEITVRELQAEDRSAVERLAQRDSNSVPAGALLGAEADGSLVAAASLHTGAVISDPFASSSGSAVELLRLRARQLAAAPAGGSRLRRIVGGFGRSHAEDGLAGSPLVLFEGRHRQAC